MTLELLLSRLLVLSLSLLWYPLILGIKTHQIIIIVLTLFGCLSGNLIKHIYFTYKHAPQLIIGLFGWVVTLSFTTFLYDTIWSPVKVISFFLQVVVANYAIYVIMNNGGVASLKMLLNFSLVFFLVIFIFFSGLAISNIIDIFIFSISETDSQLTIFQFFKMAPLFQNFSADGLGGIRHTISFYLVFVFLVNLFTIKKIRDVIITVSLIFLIIIFLSRSAWLAILPSLIIYILFKFFISRSLNFFTPIKFMLISLFVFYLLEYFGPLITDRLSQTKSYYIRLNNFNEALNLLNNLSLLPIDSNRTFNSSHMFILDSYISGGILGLILSAVVIVNVFIFSLPHMKIGIELRYLGFVFSFPLFIRLFTAGSGLPGIGATICFSMALYLSMNRCKSVRM